MRAPPGVAYVSSGDEWAARATGGDARGCATTECDGGWVGRGAERTPLVDTFLLNVRFLLPTSRSRVRARTRGACVCSPAHHSCSLQPPLLDRRGEALASGNPYRSRVAPPWRTRFGYYLAVGLKVSS